MNRAYFVDPGRTKEDCILRIGSAKLRGVNIPFRMTRSDMILLQTIVRAWIGDYPHDPDGCETDACPCRTCKAEETLSKPMRQIMREMMP